jgi:hypothetical protein
VLERQVAPPKIAKVECGIPATDGKKLPVDTLEIVAISRIFRLIAASKKLAAGASAGAAGKRK